MSWIPCVGIFRSMLDSVNPESLSTCAPFVAAVFRFGDTKMGVGARASQIYRVKPLNGRVEGRMG